MFCMRSVPPVLYGISVPVNGVLDVRKTLKEIKNKVVRPFFPPPEFVIYKFQYKQQSNIKGVELTPTKGAFGRLPDEAKTN